MNTEKCDRQYPHGPHADARHGWHGLVSAIHHFFCLGIKRETETLDERVDADEIDNR